MKSHCTTVIVICFLGITACGGNYDGKKTIRNNSSHPLKVLIYKRFPVEIARAFSIQPQGEAVVESFTGGKSSPYYGNGKGCGSNGLDSTVIEVIDNNQLEVAKDLNSTDNWAFSKESNARGVDTECRATITDADIVPKSN